MSEAKPQDGSTVKGYRTLSYGGVSCCSPSRLRLLSSSQGAFASAPDDESLRQGLTVSRVVKRCEAGIVI